MKRKSNTTDMSPRTKANLAGPTRHWFIKVIRAQIASDLKDFFRLDIDKTADSKQHYIVWKQMIAPGNEKEGKTRSQPEEKNLRTKKRNLSNSPPSYPNKRSNRQLTRHPAGISVCSTIVVVFHIFFFL